MKLMIKASLVLAIILCAACSSQKSTTIWVNSYKTSTNNSEMPQLTYQEGEQLSDSSWVALDFNIDEFDYQPGHIYKLKVNLPDENSKNAKLIKVEEKQVDKKLRLNDIWKLESIEGMDIPAEELNVVQIDINFAQAVISGQGFCNRFSAPIVYVGDSKIKLNNAISTRKACMKGMDLENAFFKKVNMIDNYKLEELKLTFFDVDGNKLFTCKKID